jgi:hypothetical protein
MSVASIKALHDTAKQAYDRGGCPSIALCDVSKAAIQQLAASATTRYISEIGDKSYSVFDANQRLSRPYLPELYIDDPENFAALWDDFISSLDGKQHVCELPAESINKLLYSSVTAFSICYDLWNPGARKTPGTFYEVLMGSVFGLLLPTFVRTKFIPIPNETESVSTDIVFASRSGGGGLVIPTKITTRDRVVQPFAHQRILDNVFGANRFKSILVCVSELQREGDDGANEICVPGTIRLFQKHLSQLSGIYYLDPPSRYLQNDVTSIIRVDTVGDLLKKMLPELILSCLS